MTIISAFQLGDGIQVNRQISDTEMSSDMVYPDDPGWIEALAAAGYFSTDGETPPPPTEAELREYLRSVTVITRAQFIQNCVTMHLMPEEDALPAARGDVPPHFEAALWAIPEEEKLQWKIRWAGTEKVTRYDPFVLEIAKHKSWTDFTLDDIFGITITS